MAVTLVDATDGDVPIIERWLCADHVRRFWGEPAENSRLLRRPPPGAHHALIVADGRKIGLVVRQHPSRRELDDAGLHDIPESVIDIDIMIGEPGAVGRGAGPNAIRLAAGEALADPRVPFVIAATSLDNTASRRAFAKAGFLEDREFDDVPNGRYVLLVRRRPDARDILDGGTGTDSTGEGG
ncbi:MAG: acetyltransferase [Candidatus Hydrogenedentes bacterium]|nr:acetyltransferase [Candidatus Hydrogenedentota bacterium]